MRKLKFSTIEEIKYAVDTGLTVHWMNEGYIVRKTGDQYNIVFERNGSTIGLTDASGKNLNGSFGQFYAVRGATEYCGPDGERRSVAPNFDSHAREYVMILDKTNEAWASGDSDAVAEWEKAGELIRQAIGYL